MGMQTIVHDATFNLSKSHVVNFLRIGGFSKDTIQVRIDGHKVLDAQYNSSIGKSKQVHNFVLDELPVEIWWRYDRSGDPKYIALVYNGSLLAKYGRGEEIDTLSSQLTTISNNQAAPVKIELLKETTNVNAKEIVSKEIFPLDNRAGSGVLTAQHTIRKTLNNQLKLDKNRNSTMSPEC